MVNFKIILILNIFIIFFYNSEWEIKFGQDNDKVLILKFKIKLRQEIVDLISLIIEKAELQFESIFKSNDKANLVIEIRKETRNIVMNLEKLLSESVVNHKAIEIDDLDREIQKLIDSLNEYMDKTKTMNDKIEESKISDTIKSLNEVKMCVGDNSNDEANLKMCREKKRHF